MMLRSTLRLPVLLPVFALCAAGAQQPRFTTQLLLVPTFRGDNHKMANKATDIVRDRVADAFPRSELRVISGGDIDDWLRLSGFEEDVVLSDGELGELAKKFRADERITGVVTGATGHVHIDARLSLIRDLRLMQPLTADGSTVNEAAESIAKQAIAARRQFIPTRVCENSLRAMNAAAAAAAAAQGIAAYPQAVAARVCLMNSATVLGVKADSIVSVAQAILRVAPTNPIALERLAETLDLENKPSEAAPVWVRYLQTDSSNENLIETVVNALSREGNATLAAPIVDRGTTEHPDNLVLLKLRWLVHLAANDWAGAVTAGAMLLEKDPSSQSDPEFYARLANAYRADREPARAVATAATGVAKFPKDAPLFAMYVELLHVENEAALPRGLALFPESAELHVLAAQSAKSTGNTSGALAETKRALAVNPKLPHGFLQLAQLSFDAAQPDSALAAMDQAIKNGESATLVAQFALARGNALYKTATASQKRDDYALAMKFLGVANQLAPSPEAKFLLGASSLSISQSAATEATPAKSCELSKLADASLTDAEINLASGGSVAPDAAKQFLDYVAKLRPYVAEQLKSFCGSATSNPTAR